MLSWSVSVRSSTPFLTARATSSAGVSVPSEKIEWQCSSTRFGTLNYSLPHVFSLKPKRMNHKDTKND